LFRFEVRLFVYYSRCICSQFFCKRSYHALLADDYLPSLALSALILGSLLYALSTKSIIRFLSSFS
jgi:hypothetical protein